MTIGQGLYGLPEVKPPPRKPSRLRNFLKVLMYIGFFALMCMTALRYAGGNSQNLKLTIEKFIGDSTGYAVTVGTLNAVSFFPLIGIDMDNVTLQSPSHGTVAHFDHINFSTSFWNASTGSAFHSLDIKNAVIESGIWLPGKVDVEHFFIDVVKDKRNPKLSFAGSYNAKPVTMTVDLRSKAGFFGPSFDLASPSTINVEAGDIQAVGVITSGVTGRKFQIDHLKAGKNMQPVKTTLSIFRTFSGVDLSGQAELGASTIDYDLDFEHDKAKRVIKGKLTADKLDFDDVLKEGGFIDSYNAIKEFYRAGTKDTDAGYDFSDLDLDVDMKIDHLFKAGVDFGKMTAKAKTKDGIMSVDPIEGSIKDGELKGQASLDSKSKPAALNTDFTIKQADYTSMTSMLAAADEKRGRADVKVSLASKGNDGDQLWSGLNGKATILAGPGGLKSPLINLWGGGLLNTMLPKLNKSDAWQLNCGIGDFVIENGRAKTKTLFLDTDRVTIAGDGAINLANSTIDMKLEPKSKDTAFFSAATAVNVSGKLDHPRIEPDVFSLGKKLGGLFLGTINPVYLAFSLTDMGESNTHPCSAYIKK